MNRSTTDRFQRVEPSTLTLGNVPASAIRQMLLVLLLRSAATCLTVRSFGSGRLFNGLPHQFFVQFVNGLPGVIYHRRDRDADGMQSRWDGFLHQRNG